MILHAWGKMGYFLKGMNLKQKNPLRLLGAGFYQPIPKLKKSLFK
jgi:hypothetical protein